MDLRSLPKGSRFGVGDLVFCKNFYNIAARDALAIVIEEIARNELTGSTYTVLFTDGTTGNRYESEMRKVV